ncbi:MAG TPA: trypsin-like peptidase domain-containing protein [Patescibacteria group bacterium]|nr:trypsin-like peptidase domain-containing protein [Patescibacteria group bacterium]
MFESKHEKELSKHYGRETLILCILVSLIVGGISGGLVGSVLGGSMKYSSLLSFFEPTGNQSAESTQTVKAQEESQTIDTVKKVSPAVVSIVISADLSKYYQRTGPNIFPFGDIFDSGTASPQSGKQTIGGGSGFIVSADGMILTNKHVVDRDDVDYTVVTSDGKQYPAIVLARDPSNDIGIVKIEATNLPTLEFGDSDSVQIGQTVIAIGYSLAQYQNTVTKGVVSGLARNITAGSSGSAERLEGVIQTDAAINQGNSGGPLVSLEGLVVGINTAIDQQGQLIGFSIPINVVKPVVESVKKTGKIIRPFIGIRYIPITKGLAEANKLPFDYGVQILKGTGPTDTAVVAGSPAEKAGLKEGDIILELNGVKLDGDHSLVGQLSKHNVGDEITLKVSSGGQLKDVKIKLEERKE